MNLIEARELALTLMKEHDLFERGWSFGFSNARTQLGLAKEVKVDGKVATRTIYLSRPLTLLNEPATMRKVMLHEVAHALAGVDAGHGKLWKAHAIALGVSPTACTNGAVGVEGKVLGTCKNRCGYTWRQHKITWSTYAKTVCPDCSDRRNRRFVYLDWTRDGRPLACPKRPKPRARKRRYARR